MLYKKISLKTAIDFHGHLGPYLILGILAGQFAVEKLNCKKYFGLRVKVWGARLKPKSCLIDGLQLSTGATYGKGNIAKLNGSNIKIEFYDLLRQNKVVLKLKKKVVHILNRTTTHKDCELLAKKLYKSGCYELFNIIT